MVFQQLPFRVTKHLLYLKQTTFKKFHGVTFSCRFPRVGTRRPRHGLSGERKRTPASSVQAQKSCSFEIIGHPHVAELGCRSAEMLLLAFRFVP